MSNETLEKSNLESQLIQALLAEQKSTRIWKNVRFFVWLIIVFLIILLLFGPKTKSNSSTTAHSYVSLIRLSGTIMSNTHFSAKTVLPQLRKAFQDKDAKGVVLVINSPGGSPVQASIIHDKIIQLKREYHKPVIVYGEDTLASGAYLVATAADRIYVNKDTVTGSIGVIMEGFGFENVMSKLGVTRRVFTAGDNKDRLDPFVAMRPQDKQKIQKMLEAVHQDFIQDVMLGRKGKLNGNVTELFSGDFWTGTQAAKLGLVDGTSNLWDVMEQNFDTTHYRDYTARDSFWQDMMKDVSTKLHLFPFTKSQLKLSEVL